MHTLEEFKREMWLDERVGRFFWHRSGPGRRADLQVGAFDVHGYGQIQFKRVVYKEHRLVWFFITGEWPNNQIDHINHDRRDNRFENLREVNNQENHTNRPIQNNNTSGVVGVHFCKRAKLFQAYINIAGKRKYLGWFKQIEGAIEARRAANLQYGFHENHGRGTSRPKYKKICKQTTQGAIMTHEKMLAAAKLNEIENHMNIINECITKTEDSLILTRQVQAITRKQLAEARAALAALPD